MLFPGDTPKCQCLGGRDTASVGSDSRLSIKSGRLMHREVGVWLGRAVGRDQSTTTGGVPAVGSRLVTGARVASASPKVRKARLRVGRSTRHRADLAKSGGPSRPEGPPSRFLNPRARASPSPSPLPQTPRPVAILLTATKIQSSPLLRLSSRHRDTFQC